MQSVTKMLQDLARQQGEAKNPLLLLHTVEASQGTLISHLPLSPHLVQTWIEITGAPFCQHQSLSLAALRRGEPFALVGGGAAAHQTLHFLLQEMLLREPGSGALLLLPTEESAELHLELIAQWNSALGSKHTAAYVGQSSITRESARASILLTTPHALHERLLRHHDRAWHAFWQRLRLAFLFDLEHYSGVAAAHLAALLMRSARLMHAPPLLAATLAEAAGADETLLALTGQPWRLFPVHDVPHRATTLAVWHTAERINASARLARYYQRQGYRVHILCETLEVPWLLSLMETTTSMTGLTFGPAPAEADVQILAGYAGVGSWLRQVVAGSFHHTPLLTLLVPGARPVERALVRMCRKAEPGAAVAALLNTPPPSWLPPPTNAYISAHHLLCAASERPLSASEVADWHAEELVARLARREQLTHLPVGTDAWRPAPGAGDPYENFGLRTAGGSEIAVFNERGVHIGALDMAVFDRWSFFGAAMPPGRGGYRVAARNDETGTVTFRSEHEGRRTFPLRRCSVNVRDEREACMMRGQIVAWGRVVIEEEIYGYREVRPDAPPTDQAVAPPLHTRWTAPALRIDLPIRLKANGQLVGWSLVSAVPMRVLCAYTDLVPAYDAALNRLYLVDAQPGGNGLAEWLYAELHDVLPLAYDIALGCQDDALWEPMARADMDWLLSMLGGEVALPDDDVRRPTSKQTREHANKREWHAPAAPQQPPPASRPRPEAPPAPTPPAPHPAPAPEQSKREHSSPSSEQRKMLEEFLLGREQGTEPAPPTEPLPPPATPEAKKPQRQKRASSPQRSRSAASHEEPSSPPAAPEAKKPQRQKRANTAQRPRQEPPPAETQPAPRPAREKKTTPASEQQQPAPELPPDASAILARLQRQRQQQEATEQHDQPAQRPDKRAGISFDAEPYFKIGDRVSCRSYGTGIVRAIRVEKGHEILSIEFPDYGVLDINPSLNLVQRIDPDKHSPDDDPGF